MSEATTIMAKIAAYAIVVVWAIILIKERNK